MNSAIDYTQLAQIVRGVLALPDELVRHKIERLQRIEDLIAASLRGLGQSPDAAAQCGVEFVRQCVAHYSACT
jgi:hypothetical protein